MSKFSESDLRDEVCSVCDSFCRPQIHEDSSEDDAPALEGFGNNNGFDDESSPGICEDSSSEEDVSLLGSGNYRTVRNYLM